MVEASDIVLAKKNSLGINGKASTSSKKKSFSALIWTTMVSGVFSTSDGTSRTVAVAVTVKPSDLHFSVIGRQGNKRSRESSLLSRFTHSK